MITVDLNDLNLSYKIMPPNFIERSLENHCNKIKCTKCKYYSSSYGNCNLLYTLGHNLMRTDEEYIVISNEESHFIYNQDVYCRSKLCKECRYNGLIYNERGQLVNCYVARIVAHRIITGEIARNQYKIKNVELQSIQGGE